MKNKILLLPIFLFLCSFAFAEQQAIQNSKPSAPQATKADNKNAASSMSNEELAKIMATVTNVRHY